MKTLILIVLIIFILSSIMLLISCDGPRSSYEERIKINYIDNTTDTIYIRYYYNLYITNEKGNLVDYHGDVYAKKVKSYSRIKENNVLKDTK